MKMIERAEPECFVAHYEMLRINCNRLMEVVRRAANNSCCICCDDCLACDAKQLLRDFGVDDESV